MAMSIWKKSTKKLYETNMQISNIFLHIQDFYTKDYKILLSESKDGVDK